MSTKSLQLDKTVNSISAERLDETRRHVEEASRLIATDEDDARLQKLDIITDVQLVLVEKYRRAAKLMWIAIGCLVVCIGGLVVVALIGVDLQRMITHLVVEQRGIIAEQKAAKKAAEEASKKADETAKKVDEAVEASPKIEIDDQGKAKVVVPVKKAEPKAPKGDKADKGDASAAPPEPPAPKSAEFPIQLK